MFIENASILKIDLLCVLISFLLPVEILTPFSGSCNKPVANNWAGKLNGDAKS